MRVVNAYTIRGSEIEVGDIMMYVVKAMVVRPGIYKLYRCPFEYQPGDPIPQGSRILHEEEVCEALFPTLAHIAHRIPIIEGGMKC